MILYCMQLQKRSYGFTLVEILAILIIISLIGVIISSNVGNTLSNGKNITYDNKVSVIVNAGIEYGEDRLNYIQKKGTEYVSVSTLIDDEYLDEEENGGIINPKTNSKFNGCVKLVYNEDKLNISGSYVTSCS